MFETQPQSLLYRPLGLLLIESGVRDIYNGVKKQYHGWNDYSLDKGIEVFSQFLTMGIARRLGWAREGASVVVESTKTAEQAILQEIGATVTKTITNCGTSDIINGLASEALTFVKGDIEEQVTVKIQQYFAKAAEQRVINHLLITDRAQGNKEQIIAIDRIAGEILHEGRNIVVDIASKVVGNLKQAGQAAQKSANLSGIENAGAMTLLQVAGVGQTVLNTTKILSFVDDFCCTMSSKLVQHTQTLPSIDKLLSSKLQEHPLLDEKAALKIISILKERKIIVGNTINTEGRGIFAVCGINFAPYSSQEIVGTAERGTLVSTTGIMASCLALDSSVIDETAVKEAVNMVSEKVNVALLNKVQTQLVVPALNYGLSHVTDGVHERLQQASRQIIEKLHASYHKYEQTYTLQPASGPGVQESGNVPQKAGLAVQLKTLAGQKLELVP